MAAAAAFACPGVCFSAGPAPPSVSIGTGPAASVLCFIHSCAQLCSTVRVCMLLLRLAAALVSLSVESLTSVVLQRFSRAGTAPPKGWAVAAA
eukprot:1289779-Rhodomonas_salina.1